LSRIAPFTTRAPVADVQYIDPPTKDWAQPERTSPQVSLPMG